MDETRPAAPHPSPDGLASRDGGDRTDAPRWPVGTGEMAVRTRDLDWAASPLGPSAAWPPQLRSAVQTALDSAFATYVWWGPELTQLHNDAAVAIMRAKHPAALGRPVREVWAEIWPVIGPMLDRVLAVGEPFTGEDLEFLLDRGGGPREPTTFTFSFSALRDAAGAVAGVQGVAIETTERVRAERARRAGEAKYRSLFESIDEGFCVLELLLDDDGAAVDYRFLEVNPAFERQTGLVDAPGRLGSEVAPDLETQWLATYAEVVRTGEPRRLESYNQGTDRWYEAYASRLGDAGDRRVCAVVEDVTERRRDERRQAFLLALSDALRPLGDPIAIKGEASRLLGEHLRTDRAYYVEIDEGRGLAVVERDHIRGDAPSLAGAHPLEAFGAVLEPQREGLPFACEDVLSDPRVAEADRAAYVERGLRSFLTVPLIKAGELAATLSVTLAAPRRWAAVEVALLQDVAERTWAAVERARAEAALRQNEAKYRSLFASIDEGFGLYEVLRDEAGRPVDALVLEVNAAYERLTGREQAAGRRLSELVPRLAWEWVDALGRVAASGEPARYERYNAEVDRWFDVHLSPMDGPDDPRLAVVFADVTERHRLADNRALLADVSRELVTLDDVPDAMERLGERIGRHFGATWCNFAEMVDDGETSVAASGWNVEGTSSLSGTYRLREYFSDEHMEANRAGRPTIVEDTAADPRVDRDAYGALGIRSFATTPLARGGPWRFQLSVVDVRPRRWRDDEVALLQELTDRIWSRLERARAEEALREREERQAFLLTLSDALRPLADPVEIQEAATRLLGEHLSTDRALYAEVLGDGEEIVIHRDFVRGVPSMAMRLRGADYGEAHVAAHRAGRPVRIVDAEADPSLSEEERVALRSVGIRANLSVGLIKDGRWVAALGLHMTTPRAWTEAELALLEETAERTWAAMERAHAEAALAASRAEAGRLGRLLEATLTSLDDFVYVWGADRRVSYANRQAERLFGLPVGGMEGKAAGDLLPDGDTAARLEGEVDEVFRTGSTVTGEIDFQAPTGTVGHFEYTFNPVRDADGRVATVAGIGRDVTARRRAELAVRESEARFRSFAEASSDTLWIVDAESRRLEFLSPAYERTWGEPRDAVLADLGRWGDLVYPGDVPAEGAPFERALAGDPVVAEYRIVRPVDGEVRWIQDTGFPIRDEDGRVVRVAGIAQDVTEQRRAAEAMRESEAKYRTLFESMDQGFGVAEILVDAAGRPVDYRMLEVNPRFEALTGQPREVFVAGKTVREVAPELEEHWYDLYGRVGLTGEPARFELAAAEWGRWFEVSAYRIDPPELRRVGILFSDVTERRRSEDALRQALADLAFLDAVGERLRGGGDPDALMADLCALTGRHLRVDRCRFVWLDAADETWWVEQEWRAGADVTPGDGVFPASVFPEAMLAGLRVGEALVVTDSLSDDRTEGTARPAVAALFRACVAVPVLRGGRPVVNLAVYAQTPRGWTDREVQLVRTVAERAWDTVERVRAELALRESEGRFRTLFESMDEGFLLADVVVDDAGRPVDVAYVESNPAATRMVMRDMTGLRLSEVSPGYDSAWVETLGRVARTGLGERLERFAEPEARWFDLYAFKPDTDDAESRRVAVIFRDVTERRVAEAALRESEGRFRTLVQNLPDYAIFTVGPDLRMTTWTDGAARVKGYAADEVIGRHISLFYRPEDVAAGWVDREFAEAAERGRAERESWRVRKDGTHFWVNEIATAVHDPAGRLVGFTKISRDLTERMRAEEALRESEASLAARVVDATAELRTLSRRLLTVQEEERRHLARELHDEVGQMLTGLGLQLGGGGTVGAARLAEARRIVAELTEQVRRLSTDLRPAALDGFGLVPALRWHIERYETRTGVRVDLRHEGADRRLPPAVEIAAFRIVQEALTNVARHAAAGEATVQVFVDGSVLLAVRDEGRGFDATSTPGTSGLGGMRERAELLGGSLTVESAPDGGTRVTAELPLGDPGEAEGERA